MIATPDHTHASIAHAALLAGKHVYCQKPLTHDIYEARVLARAAAQAKGSIAVMGNQHHSSAGNRRVADWVRAGVIGEVKRVIAWCSLNYRPFGNAYWFTLTDRPPAETPAVPDTLDWNLWLGHAKERPYHPTYHPGRWRAWWDFGCGMMGDRGVHTLDAACNALDLGKPSTIERLSIDGSNEFIHPDKAHILYRFPVRGTFPAMELDWYSGERPAELDELTEGQKVGDDQGGALFIGTRGMISHGTYPSTNLALHPAELREEARQMPATMPETRGSHEAVWVAACKGEGPVSSGFEYAAALTELTHLGNLAIQLGGTIEWDAAKGEVTNRPEAVSEFSLPLQSRALTHLLNMPESEANIWIGWGIHVFKVTDGKFKTANVLEDYLHTQLDRAEREPGNDFFSALVNAEIDGRKLTREECMGFANLAFAGGRDTIIHTVSSILAHFGKHPDALDFLRTDPRRITLASEEFFRVFMPLTQIGRVCPADTTVNGVTVPADERIGLCWASANHDEQVFAVPHEIRLDRKPNPHLSFGFGEHLCLGAPHARLIVRTLLTKLSQKIQRIDVFESIGHLEQEEKFTRMVGYAKLRLRLLPMP